jgi:inner membrane protein
VDNLTHSLIGVAFARVLPKRWQRPEIYWASVLGNNAPDADFLMRFWPGTTSLDYLVHHRGYTHTFLFAPAMGLVAAGVAKLFHRKAPWSAELVAIAIAASFLHIGADYLNSYGVHPFSPFWNRWFYGDAVYIVEPLLWFVLLPFILKEAERPWAKAGWAMIGVAMVALVWIFPTFSFAHSSALTAFFALSALVQLRLVPRLEVRRAVAIALFALVLGSFFAGGNRAREILREEWRKATAGREVFVDLASNSTPGHPWCWTLWLASRDGEAFYFRAAEVSLWPSLFPAESCDALSSVDRTAELRKIEFPSGARTKWELEARFPLAEWRTLRDRSCTFRKLLSFARFPFAKTEADGSVVAGDHRYDRQKELGFSEVRIAKDENCPPKSGAEYREGPWEFPLRER